MAVERSLILIKPDAVQRRLAGEILARIERRGFTVRGGKLVHADRELGATHYAEHREKPFFGELVDFITSGPLVAMVLEGVEAVKAARQVIGATNPLEAAPGSIRLGSCAPSARPRPARRRRPRPRAAAAGPRPRTSRRCRPRLRASATMSAKATGAR